MLFYKYNSVTVKDGPSFIKTIISSSYTLTNKTIHHLHIFLNKINIYILLAILFKSKSIMHSCIKKHKNLHTYFKLFVLPRIVNTCVFQPDDHYQRVL